MTVRKGATTQVLLIPDALTNSTNDAEWTKHEVRFAKTEETISPTTSKFEALKSKVKDYKPSLNELGSLYQVFAPLRKFKTSVNVAFVCSKINIGVSVARLCKVEQVAPNIFSHSVKKCFQPREDVQRLDACLEIKDSPNKPSSPIGPFKHPVYRNWRWLILQNILWSGPNGRVYSMQLFTMRRSTTMRNWHFGTRRWKAKPKPLLQVLVTLGRYTTPPETR